MKSSFTDARDIELSIDLGIGEMQTIVDALEKRIEGGENDWAAGELLKSLKSTRSEGIRRLRDSLKHYA